MTPPWQVPAADRRLLPEGRMSGPMPWVIAIMMFLTVLAAAFGLGLGHAARGLGESLGDRLTIQIVEANPTLRDRQASAAAAELGRLVGVRGVRRVPPSEMRRLLEPWLGDGGFDGDVPLPALIDVDLAPDGRDRRDAIAAAVRGVAPAARIDDHASALAPLVGLIGALKWLAVGLVLLMSLATAAAVVLAARAALNTHRATIEVLHLMGATDVQVARLFQRRIALDALFGGLMGLVGALAVILLIGGRVSGIGSELLGSVTLPPWAWLVLLLLPFAGTALSTLAARHTVLRALRHIL